jgi:hypothetical protein
MQATMRAKEALSANCARELSRTGPPLTRVATLAVLLARAAEALNWKFHQSSGFTIDMRRCSPIPLGMGRPVQDKRKDDGT